MNKLAVTFVVLAFVLVSVPGVQAQSTDEEYEKLIEMDDNLYFDPDPAIVKGLKITKQLHAEIDGGDFKYPQTIGIHDGYLWIFDVEIEKLLKFSLDGEFLGSPFPEDLKIVNPIRFMDFDEQGRILLSDGKDYYIFEQGKELIHYNNQSWVTSTFWKDGKVTSVNPYSSERDEGLMQSIDLESKKRETWGARPDGITLSKFPVFWGAFRKNNQTYSFFSRKNKVVVADLDSKQVQVFSPDIDAFKIRERRTQEILDYVEEHKIRSYRYFPVMGSAAGTGDRFFVVDGLSRFIRILEFDSEFKLTAVYQMVRDGRQMLTNFTVSERDGELLFYFLTIRQVKEESIREVYIAEPTEVGPTLADALAWEEKLKSDPEVVKQEKEYERERKISKEYEQLRKAIKASNDKEESIEKYIEFYNKYPENWAGCISLYYAARLAEKESALKIKPLILTAFEEATEESNISNLADGILQIALKLEEKGLLKIAWQKNKTVRYMRFQIMRYLEAARQLKAWDFMDAVLADAANRIEQSSLDYLVGSGTLSKPSIAGKQFLFILSFFKGLLAYERGDYERAIAEFDNAEINRTKEDLGRYDDYYHVYRAKALAATGHKSEAIALLLPLALFTDQQQNMEALEDIYAQSGREGSFAEFIEAEKSRRMKKLDELVVFDLDKNPVIVNDKLGKLTILTFWTPDT